MEMKLIGLILESGVVGIIAVLLLASFILCKYVMRLYKDHKAERKEWRDDSNRREDRAIAVQERVITTIASLEATIKVIANGVRNT